MVKFELKSNMHGVSNQPATFWLTRGGCIKNRASRRAYPQQQEWSVCDVIREIHLETELNSTSWIWAKWPDIFAKDFMYCFLEKLATPGKHSRAFKRISVCWIEWCPQYSCPRRTWVWRYLESHPNLAIDGRRRVRFSMSMKSWVPWPVLHKPGMMVHACGPSTE